MRARKKYGNRYIQLRGYVGSPTRVPYTKKQIDLVKAGFNVNPAPAVAECQIVANALGSKLLGKRLPTKILTRNALTVLKDLNRRLSKLETALDKMSPENQTFLKKLVSQNKHYLDRAIQFDEFVDLVKHYQVSTRTIPPHYTSGVKIHENEDHYEAVRGLAKIWQKYGNGAPGITNDPYTEVSITGPFVKFVKNVLLPVHCFIRTREALRRISHKKQFSSPPPKRIKLPSLPIIIRDVANEFRSRLK